MTLCLSIHFHKLSPGTAVVTMTEESPGAELGQQIYEVRAVASTQAALCQTLADPGGHPYRKELKLKDAHSRTIMLPKCSPLSCFYPSSKLRSSPRSFRHLFRIALALAFRHLANPLEFKLN